LNRKLDKKYDDLALTALHEYLSKQDVPEKNLPLKKELLEAFEYSGNIKRGNNSEEQVRIFADNVFKTCISLTRCLFFPKEAKVTLCQEKECILDTQSQTDLLRRNMNELKLKVKD